MQIWLCQSPQIIFAIGMRIRHESSRGIPLILLALSSLAGAAGAQNPAPQAASTCPASRGLAVDELTGATAAFARAARVAGEPDLDYGLIRRPSSETETAICGRFATLWDERLGDVGSATSRLEFEVRPIRIDNTVNSGYARDRNNGAVWAGRGLSSGLSGGILVRWGALSAGVQPLIAFHQNADFDIKPLPDESPRSPWTYAGETGIDWPQRFGTGSFTMVDLGQSFVRVDLYGLAAGLSNENLWWGPAREYPLMISNTAPGFPHLFFGTGRPLDIWIGDVETQVVLGQLRASSYFEDRRPGDFRILAGVVGVFHPRILEGITLGAASFYAVRQDQTEDFLRSFTGLVNSPGNGLASLFGRWTLPASAFSAYLEIGRNDHWVDLADLITQPEHATAYMVGVEKGFPVGGNRLHVYGEIARLQRSSSFRTHRGFPTFYTHSSVSEGHTQRGQLLGPAIGPGSNGLMLGADLFVQRGRIGATFERVDYHKDAYYDTFVRARRLPDGDGRDLEHVLGIHQLLFVRSFDLEWGLSVARRQNRHFIDIQADERPDRVEFNVGVQLRAAWRPQW